MKRLNTWLEERLGVALDYVAENALALFALALVGIAVLLTLTWVAR